MVVFQLSEVFFLIFNRQCFAGCLITLLIFILIDYSINSSTKIKYQYCDNKKIQEHYMNNLSAFHLLQTKPVRSNVFEYEIINNGICEKDNTDIDLLILIISKASSYERRYAIRQTYGNLNNIYKHLYDTSSRLIIRLLFMINIDDYLIKNILYEQKLFNDIVQLKIPEKYLMNTYRDMAILEWTSKYCRKARFIFKMDDFVFINPFLLIKFINENENDRFDLDSKNPLDINVGCLKLNARLPLLYGLVHKNENVLRTKNLFNKQSINYIITKDEYPCEIYPNYLNEHFYLISNDARDLILCTFYRYIGIPLPLSNIYITGILAEYLNIDRHEIVDYQINFHSKKSCNTFFIETNPYQAFACILNDDIKENILEQYSIYWQIIINYQVENI